MCSHLLTPALGQSKRVRKFLTMPQPGQVASLQHCGKAQRQPGLHRCNAEHTPLTSTGGDALADLAPGRWKAKSTALVYRRSWAEHVHVELHGEHAYSHSACTSAKGYVQCKIIRRALKSPVSKSHCSLVALLINMCEAVPN